jgi:hypothetical protein
MKSSNDDTRQVVSAGLLAGLAFVAAELVDRRLVSGVYSDMKLLGYAVTRRSPWWQIAALLIHEFNSLVFAFSYNRVMGPRLPGRGWRRGLLAAMIESTVLWPLVYLANLVHPAVKRGAMPPIGGWKDFAVATTRHVAFGVVLGAFCPVREPPTRRKGD